MPNRLDPETSDYMAFARRVVQAAGRRIADGDLDGLAELAELHDEIDAALATAVAGLLAEPHAYSWADIARVLGVTRQAARQRWPEARPARRAGGQPAQLR